MRSNPDLIRWILVLPAALLSAAGMVVVVAVYNVVAPILGHDAASPWWVNLVLCGVFGYYSVRAGSAVAPAAKDLVAIVLATAVPSGLIGLVFLARALRLPALEPSWWTALEVLATAVGVAIAGSIVLSDALTSAAGSARGRRLAGAAALTALVVGGLFVGASRFMPPRVERKPTAEPISTASRAEVREYLAGLADRINAELERHPPSIADCPPEGPTTFCTILRRVDLRNDLGLDRHIIVYSKRIDLDANSEARAAWGSLFGGIEVSSQFGADLDQLCRGEILELMRNHGLRVGLVYETQAGLEITRGLVDLATCLAWAETKSKAKVAE
jgi:hypothetical protein